jgi:hypothetical protein
MVKADGEFKPKKVCTVGEVTTHKRNVLRIAIFGGFSLLLSSSGLGHFTADIPEVFLLSSLAVFLTTCCYLFFLWTIHLEQKTAKKGGSKKQLSGFMLFSKENRPQIKEDTPEITFGQIGKKLGEMWRALTDEEKQGFKDRKG